jgi:ABC-type branched-subunit amino acid transport system ATPase component/predicted MFS family arabinose efflux permease
VELTSGSPDSTESEGTASLVRSVLDAEAERRQGIEAPEVLFPDDLLPGVGSSEMTLRQGLAKTGAATFVVLMLINGLDQLEGAGLSVLAPNIRDTFHVSNGTIVFVSSAAGAFLVFGALPMGWLADRFRRPRIIGWAGLAFAAMVFCTGLAVNVFTLFWARFGVGIAKASNLPVNGSLLADAYPIGIRGRIAAANGFLSGILMAISPLLVGGIATAAGGGSGWRWAFFVLGAPVVIVALMAFRLPEPPRGQYEMSDVLGEVIHEQHPAPISVESAFSRLMQIRTVKTSILAFAAIGFGLFTTPVLGSLFVAQNYHLNALERGIAFTIGSFGAVIALPFVGRTYDRLYRQNPSRALVLIGLAVLPAAVLAPAQYFMPNPELFILLSLPQAVLLSSAYYMFQPILQSIVPYRLRGLGFALGAIYVFFVGATGGALLAALLTNAYGVRAAVLMLLVPSTIIGGLMIIRSSRFIRNDLSLCVAELREELGEVERQKQAPEKIPVIQASNIDFSYGHVQVLFDVGFEVHRGEVLALLGTNGAGKSTILQVIAGLGTPSRGAIRLNGQNVTFVAPQQRTRLGIQLLPGGKGVFPTMSVRENLEVGSYIYRNHPDDRARRINRVFELFPALAKNPALPAGSMSGGQQQMLALARVLLHQPEILMIDELSLGLAPVVVQQLIGVIEQLKLEGQTIIIVEQSLNIAAAVSERAIFLEKGRVHYDGPTQDLLDRDDLARAVFLGGGVG